MNQAANPFWRISLLNRDRDFGNFRSFVTIRFMKGVKKWLRSVKTHPHLLPRPKRRKPLPARAGAEKAPEAAQGRKGSIWMVLARRNSWPRRKVCLRRSPAPLALPENGLRSGYPRSKHAPAQPQRRTAVKPPSRNALHCWPIRCGKPVADKAVLPRTIGTRQSKSSDGSGAAASSRPLRLGARALRYPVTTPVAGP